MYLHFCRHRHPARRRPFTIELHCHALTPAVEALVAPLPEKQAETAAMARAMGEPSVMHNDLSDADRKRILGSNAAASLGLATMNS